MSKRKGSGQAPKTPEKTSKGDGKPKLTVKALELRRTVPDDMAAVFANNLVVQNEESVYQLLFFEARPPLLLEEGEELRKKVESLTHVDARCVARIIMPMHLMPSVIEALQSNFQKHKARTTATSEPVKVNGQTPAK